MNKSEQVSSNNHQISLAGGRGRGPRSDVQRGQALYNEVQCITGNGHMGTLMWTDWWTDMYENITLPQLHWRPVIMCIFYCFDHKPWHHLLLSLCAAHQVNKPGRSCYWSVLVVSVRKIRFATPTPVTVPYLHNLVQSSLPYGWRQWMLYADLRC